MFNATSCTKRRKCLQVLIDGAIAQRTSTRHGNSCLSKTAKQCTQEIIGSTHSSCTFIRHAKIFQSICMNPNGSRIEVFHTGTHFIQNMETDGNIADIRYILQNTRFVTQQDSRNQCNCCIFCAANFYFSGQTPSAVNHILIQLILSFVLRGPL